MLKKRIIPVELLLEGKLVKTNKFGTWRHVGDPVKSSGVYNSQHADELIFLNISREDRTISSLREIIERVSEVSFMPMAMGGGISSAADAAELIRTGADKVVINSAAYRDSFVIAQTAELFGSQAVITSIDVRWDPDSGTYQLYSDCGRLRENITLTEHVNRCISAGTGEIMIQSIDRDGTMEGFDIQLIREVMSIATVPVIAAGGSGNYVHLLDAFQETNVSALACGSLFNFSDSNPIRAKAFLSNYGIPFRAV
jgi:cyclase